MSAIQAAKIGHHIFDQLIDFRRTRHIASVGFGCASIGIYGRRDLFGGGQININHGNGRPLRAQNISGGRANSMRGAGDHRNPFVESHLFVKSSLFPSQNQFALKFVKNRSLYYIAIVDIYRFQDHNRLRRDFYFILRVKNTCRKKQK